MRRGGAFCGYRCHWPANTKNQCRLWVRMRLIILAEVRAQCGSSSKGGMLHPTVIDCPHWHHLRPLAEDIEMVRPPLRHVHALLPNGRRGDWPFAQGRRKLRQQPTGFGDGTEGPRKLRLRTDVGEHRRSPQELTQLILKVFQSPAAAGGRSDGAQKRTRTSTPLRAPAPEAGASTNSAIWARGRRRLIWVESGDVNRLCRAIAIFPPAAASRGKMSQDKAGASG